MSHFRAKPLIVAADRLTIDNIEQVANRHNGHIKGIKLPLEEQVIECWSRITQTEIEAAIGEWLITYPDGDVVSMSDDVFKTRFEEY